MSALILTRTGDTLFTSDTEMTGDAPWARPAYLAEVSWGQTTNGLFTFGTSRFGSATDLLAASGWSTGFGGAYDNVTADARDATIVRGRDGDLSSLRAGTIVLNLRDANGRYNTQNPASPIAAYLDTDKPIRYSAILAGVSYPLYYGFLTDIEGDPSARGTAVLSAIDFLDKLDRQSPMLAPLPAGYTTGQIIGAILDWFRWTDPAMRNLGAGDTINASYTRADGSRSGLQLIQELLDAERGLLFVSRAGAVTYIDRRTRYVLPSVGTIDRKLTAFPVGKTNSAIVNQWTVQRTDMGDNNIGVAQVWPDPAAGLSPSQRLHGTIAQTLATPFLNSDSQALGLAQHLTMRTQTGDQLVYEVPISIPDQATMIQVLARDIGDRVTLTIEPRNMPPVTGDFNIESIAHTVSTRGQPRHTCVWRVSAVPPGTPFRFGVSLFGGSHYLPY